METPGDDPIETAWREVLSAWTDEAAHKRFIGLASSLKRLPEAGRRYRDVRDAPDAGPYRELAQRREIAAKRIEDILAVAMLTMAATKSPPPEKQHPKLVFVAAGICIAMIAFAVWAFVGSR